MKHINESIIGRKSTLNIGTPNYISTNSNKGKKVISDIIKGKGICFIDCGNSLLIEEFDEISNYIYRVARRNHKKVIHLDDQAGTLKTYGKSRTYRENIPSDLNDYIEYHNREWYGDGIISPDDDLVIFIDSSNVNLFMDTKFKPDWMNNDNSIIILADRNYLYESNWISLHNSIDQYLASPFFNYQLTETPNVEYESNGFRKCPR